jgi:hypothetical protein
VSDSSVGRSLAQELLALEVANTGAAVAAATAACGKLFSEMEQFIGAEGFRVLLKRALLQSRTEFRFLDMIEIGEASEDWFNGLTENAENLDETEVLGGVVAIVGGFIDLLGTFIGYDLTLRMVYRCWPDLPKTQFQYRGK